MIGKTIPFDAASIRNDFPILKEEVRGKRLVYLDSAGSAQKPKQVIDAVKHVYEAEYSNVHRGLHYMSEQTSARYEEARLKVARFINAEFEQEIIFTKGTTESINLVANSFGIKNLGPEDEIVLTWAEHHSNIIPWQLLRDQVGCKINVVPVDDDGVIRLEEFERLISKKTKIVAFCHVSNVLGTVLPVKEVTKIAHAHGAVVVIDGAQGVVHMPVDVQDLGVDFYAFGGHKVYGPSGIGVLYGKRDLLNAMPPYQGGGGMINTVTFDKTTWADLPDKFEAGTPPIAQAIGLGAAIDYMNNIGLNKIAEYEVDLLEYATQRLSGIEGLNFIGTAPGKVSVLSFTMDCAHPHDIATIIDQNGVAVRAGHHCAQPLMERFDIPSATRASFGLYNTREDVDILATSLEKVKEIFK
ncbi:MAG: cysteine desulfurase [Alphaproteobacteria bacterium]|nr:cysteine desulfurase [Alphaproteobacteria bacterium]|tara:strand:- start:913 stop:2148 length:1236 start_codon:yes stop_codon:yes gene_type:complete